MFYYHFPYLFVPSSEGFPLEQRKVGLLGPPIANLLISMVPQEMEVGPLGRHGLVQYPVEVVRDSELELARIPDLMCLENFAKALPLQPEGVMIFHVET